MAPILPARKSGIVPNMVAAVVDLRRMVLMETPGAVPYSVLVAVAVVDRTLAGLMGVMVACGEATQKAVLLIKGRAVGRMATPVRAGVLAAATGVAVGLVPEVIVEEMVEQAASQVGEAAAVAPVMAQEEMEAVPR